jgi:phage tail sheath protein FI
MPGVVVTTSTKSGPVASLRAPGSRFFAVGLLERGDVVSPILLKGKSDIATYLGDRPSFGALYDQLKVYFEEGGLEAYVVRVVGPSATTGTLSLNDRAGSPIATLRVDAANPGAWSSRLKVQVLDGFVTNTFRIIVTLDGNSVEDVNNIPDPATAVSRFATSPYVRISNLGSATVAPNNNPAVLAATALSAGSDDRANVITSGYTGALDKFVPELGDGAVAIPGQTGATIWTALVDHCTANRRIALLAAVLNETDSNLKTASAGFNTEFAGLFAPWVIISDGAYGTRSISPEGFVAAARAKAHDQEGPWRAPGGEISASTTLLGLTQEFGASAANSLDAAKVSVLRKIKGNVRLYGWRSLSNDFSNYSYLKDRDFLNRLVVMSEDVLEKYVMKTIDGKGQLLSNINAELIGMVDPFTALGGLYAIYNEKGDMVDPGYLVNVGPEINTRASLAQNKVQAILSVRISPTAGLITLNIVKVNVLAGL